MYYAPVYTPPNYIEKGYQREIRKYANFIGLSIILDYIFQLIVYSVIGGTRYDATELSEQLWQTAIYIAAMVLPVLFYKLCVKIEMKDAIPMKPVSFGIVGVGILLCIMTRYFSQIAISAVLSFLESFGIYYSDMSDEIPFGQIPYLLYVLRLVFLAPLLEEIAYRGFIMQSLRRFGDGFALIISSLAFSLVHVSPPGMINAFIVGLVLGYFALRTGSLGTSMIMHACFNLLIVLEEGVIGKLPDSLEAYYIVFMACIALGLAAFAVHISRSPGAFYLHPDPAPVIGEGKKVATAVTAFLFILAVFTTSLFWGQYFG